MNEALLAVSVGLALYVVMDALTPAERVSFVLGRITTIRMLSDRRRLAQLVPSWGRLIIPAETSPPYAQRDRTSAGFPSAGYLQPRS